MTLDGYCDHTATIADDESHQHYNELSGKASALLYERVTCQLMESYWLTVVESPAGNIIVIEGNPYIIDWCGATKGDPPAVSGSTILSPVFFNPDIIFH